MYHSDLLSLLLGFVHGRLTSQHHVPFSSTYSDTSLCAKASDYLPPRTIRTCLLWNSLLTTDTSSGFSLLDTITISARFTRTAGDTCSSFLYCELCLLCVGHASLTPQFFVSGVCAAARVLARARRCSRTTSQRRVLPQRQLLCSLTRLW